MASCTKFLLKTSSASCDVRGLPALPLLHALILGTCLQRVYLQLFEKEHTHELFKMQQAEREKTLKSQ
eukprot:561727-Pelagomonas_calceolata.AAC.1